MQLYEICDTSIKVKESSSLDFVSSKLVGVDKINIPDPYKSYMKMTLRRLCTIMRSILFLFRRFMSQETIYQFYAIFKLSQIVDVVSQMNGA
jgi:hypothetical protein